MNDPWYEMGQDAAHDGRSLRAILADCETTYERAAVMAGYMSYGDED